MQMPIRIPDVDPLPLPGPVWLFRFLLLLVFTLHLVAMNCALAGGAVAVWNAIRGRSPQHPFSRRLANELSHMLPIFLAATITLGVAALLFVQVLYGNLFYASSILIGAFWISVIALVIAAYYSYYYFSARDGQTGSAVAVGVFGVLCLLCVAFIFSNNMTLLLTPAHWLAMYRAHTAGFSLNLGDRSLPPRYLHMVVGALAVFAAILCHLGTHNLKAHPEYGTWLIRRFSIVFAVATAAQFLLGLWFLVALPRPVAIAFLFDPAVATVFVCAVLCALAAMILILVGGYTSRPVPLVNSGFGLLLITVALMVGMRHLLRSVFLHPYVNLDSLRVAPQTGMIILFFVTFVAGLGTLGYMFRLLLRAGKTPGNSAP